MRLTSAMLATLFALTLSLSAEAAGPRQMTALKVQKASDTGAQLCSLVELTVLKSAIRIKCHDYPATMFAVHNQHPHYVLPFRGTGTARIAAVMDVLMYARDNMQNFAITFDDSTDDQPKGCSVNNCRELLTVGLVKQ